MVEDKMTTKDIQKYRKWYYLKNKKFLQEYQHWYYNYKKTNGCTPSGKTKKDKFDKNLFEITKGEFIINFE